MDNREELWRKCVEFHGHECGGLLIGCRAAMYAAELLDLRFSEDEQIVCISETDACAVDAIQVILGCTMGKGNLMFHMTGKCAFSFYDRDSGKGVRLSVRQLPENVSREGSFAYYSNCGAEEMFAVSEPRIPLPEKAQIFKSYICDGCGELVGAKWIRLQGDRKLCLDCCRSFDRFHI